MIEFLKSGIGEGA